MKLFIYSSLLTLLACGHFSPSQPVYADLHLYEFPVKKYSKLIEGGFSGLAFEGMNDKSELIFWTHTDRGPNADSFKDLKTNLDQRPFLQPDFSPHLVQFRLNLETKSIHYLKEVKLKLPDGKGMSGIPNLLPQEGRIGDESPINLKNKSIPHDLLGVDPEGICFMGEHIWMVEEYGPSILRFDLNGRLQKRIVSQNYYSTENLKKIQARFGNDFILESLPKELLGRKLNRGFEGIACTDGMVYATLQSPLPHQNKEILILEFDTRKNEVTRKFTYLLDSLVADKIGDLSFFKGELYIIEQNSKIGPQSFHKIYKASLKNIPSNHILHKELVVDLVAIGFDFADKIEGLTLTPNGDIYIVNDNDFGLTGEINRKMREANVDSNKKSVLGLIKQLSRP